MAYNPYGGNPYGPPPSFGSYGKPPPGMGAPPGLVPPPGLAGPPGVASVPGFVAPPGMAAPPGMTMPSGVPQHGLQQSSRPATLPLNFQPPNNMPNINFSAPVIRLGTGAAAAAPGRPDGQTGPSGSLPGVGMERGSEQGRECNREPVQLNVPLTEDEKLRTMMIYDITDGLGDREGPEKLCGTVGRLRKWEPVINLWSRHNYRFGFALFEDHESISIALKLLREEGVDVPVKKQPGTSESSSKEGFDDIERTKLNVAFDETTLEYQRTLTEGRGEDPAFKEKLRAARQAIQQVQRELFYPPPTSKPITDGEVNVVNSETPGNVEVVNISIAQEDELADIPADMRETVAKEIAAFRDRSNQRDVERLRREEEIGERHRQQSGASATQMAGSNNIPSGPRATMAPSGPKSLNGPDRDARFVNGDERDVDFGGLYDYTDEDTDASDNGLYMRRVRRKEEDDRRIFLEMERKWLNRERYRQAALDRQQEREREETEQLQKRKDKQLSHDTAWNDEEEAARGSHPYYRDHAAWARKRAVDRQEEEARDDADRREEQEERRREEAHMERARGRANAFLDQQDRESEQRQQAAAPAAAPAPQPFRLSLGAAAQRAQASRAMPQRRTIAEVEGLLDNEDDEPTTRRQLVPIPMDALSASAGMTEEITQAVRALAQEIPSDKDGLWGWEVKWDYMDDSIVRDRLRPFVEKKIVGYLGIQEEMLVEAIEDHLRKHGSAAALVEEVEGALDDEAVDLVKKLWRMVIFFTECEKRGLPA